ncbi:hypothetical protein [Enhydrobacter sp.]|jgi:hypothetical protein|uniref:hypothetical protein n=1 Tax=Enhydrobacter sp. TaxID=1894999 RepID=UPI00262D763D|nr:hypothetical protein [Enhydrobacter sp.]WIM14444.1 MAG: hypothetical protein OJF58_005414 [Enhydrobacter sp.]
MTLEILEQAIRERRCVTGRHKDGERHFAPHAIGFKADGTPAAFVFQYGGETSSRLPPRGEWRCLDLPDLSDLRLNDDRWRTFSNYSLARQTCLAEIALSVPERPTSS